MPLNTGYKWTEPSSLFVSKKDYMNFVSSDGRVFFLQTGVHLERRCIWVVIYF